ncbi:MAG: FkbM family methyltransferase [Nostocales cyanobacterium 94392]|nr:FkbM family methyltransferase [Nostocales cyanobacterium 94392]
MSLLDMFRKLLEKLSQGKVIKRKLPSEFQKTPFFVSPDAQLKFLKPNNSAFSPDLLKIAMEHIKSGDVVWDIGANVGVFTFAAASLAGSDGYVFAVEPDIWLANLINKSAHLRANSHFNINVLPAAVSDGNNIETLLIAERGRASNALAKVIGRTQMGGVREKNLVPTVTLDQILSASKSPCFIKIDVEGAEVEVLKGASKVLSQIRPIIYCEIGPHQRNDVTNILKLANYNLYDGNLPREERSALTYCTYNTLAYPIEKDILKTIPHSLQQNWQSSDN